MYLYIIHFRPLAVKDIGTGQLWVVGRRLGQVKAEEQLRGVTVGAFGESVYSGLESSRHIGASFLECVQDRHKNFAGFGSGIGLGAEADFPGNNQRKKKKGWGVFTLPALWFYFWLLNRAR